MEVMTDVLVGRVRMSRYSSRFVSKAVARARSARGRLMKIVGHHELVWRGLARRTNGEIGVRQGSDFFGRFCNMHFCLVVAPPSYECDQPPSSQPCLLFALLSWRVECATPGVRSSAGL